MQKWEYCAIVGVARNERRIDASFPTLWRFAETGVETIDIKGKEGQLVGQIIFKLGEEGWEMVGTGASGGGTTHLIYFKRPKT